MPEFAHLPLILKPFGNGKLSKRDGAKFNMPVFPLAWEADKEEDSFLGFKEFGFSPEAAINFLAFLGWNPGTEQEIFSLDELCEAFSIEKIGKAGARFDYDKAKWFNQQYIHASASEDLARVVRPLVAQKGYEVSDAFLISYCELMKDRTVLLTDFIDQGIYFFEGVKTYDDKNISKRWSPETKETFLSVIKVIENTSDFDAPSLETSVKNFINENGLKMGKIFPLLRISLAGTMKGPDVFKMIELLGKSNTMERLQKAVEYFDNL